MSELIRIPVPLVNPNDPSVTLLEWLVSPDVAVVAGDVVARLETTKAVVDVEAPETGVLQHAVEAGAELTPGFVIGFIQVAAGAASGLVGPEGGAAAIHSDEPRARLGDVRLTRRARRTAERIGVDPEELGLTGLVTTRKLLDAAEEGSSSVVSTDQHDQVGATPLGVTPGMSQCHRCGNNAEGPLILTLKKGGQVRGMCVPCVLQSHE